MNANFFIVQTHLWGMWRYHWHAILMAWFICLIGWSYVYVLPDKYIVSARVHVDTQSVLKPLLRGLTVETNILNTVLVMKQAMLSRPNIEKVARDTDLHLRAKNKKELEAIYDGLRKKIKIEGVSRTNENTFLITYFDSDRFVAKKVVDSLLTSFMENTLGVKRLDTKSAQQFIDKQIKEYEARLDVAEEALKEFKRKNVGLMPDKGIDYFQRLQAALRDLDKVSLEWKEAQNRARSIKRQLSGEEPTFGFSSSDNSNATTRALDVRINKLEEKMDELTTTYTDNHPDVVAVMKTISALKTERREEIKNMGSMGAVVRADENPVYQQLKISLGSAEAEASALRVRRNEYKARVNKLEKAVDTIPKIEADLTRLNRDYNVIKGQYETLLARRESARLSDEAEKSTEDVKFRIIDPPRMPLSPSGPNRILFATIILIAGVIAGLALALFFSQIKPVYISGRDLVKDTGLPLLGSVTMVSTEIGRKNNMRLIRRFSLTGILLVVVYVAVVINFKYDLVQKITSTAVNVT